MSQATHTYGPTCRLSRKVAFSNSKGHDDCPELEAQFFYSSPLPIDDPLSVVPTPNGSESKSVKHPLRPFSAYDNDSLEEAWRGLASGKDKTHQKKFKDSTDGNLLKLGENPSTGQASRIDSQSSKSATPQKASQPVQDSKSRKYPHASTGPEQEPASKDVPGPQTITELHRSIGLSKGAKPARDSDAVSGSRDGTDQHSEVDKDHEQSDRSIGDIANKDQHGAIEKHARLSQGDGADERSPKEHQKASSESETYGHRAFRRHEHSDPHGSGSSSKTPNYYLPPGSLDEEDDVGISGKPFVKLPTRRSSPQRQSLRFSKHDGAENQKPGTQSVGNYSSELLNPAGPANGETEAMHVHDCKAHRNTKDHASVTVGISRLHLVKLPALHMQPIYWSPVHDEASVTRGTWFYKNTMYPVEPAVANQLESCYRELGCWSETWNDELKSAMEVGAAGEEKIAHRLWPKETDARTSSHKSMHPHLSTDPYCAARCFDGEAAAEGSIVPGEKLSEPKVLAKKYSNAQIIYKDAQNAFILKPNLQPSAYYGRKPLQKIMKGATVGIHVVRGFDWKSWDKLHPSKKTDAVTKAEENAPVAGDADAAKSNFCPACRSQEEQPKVTDLCLVVHGIGQKLSERMESFHFTHAMNAFRRSVTAERGNDAVKNVFRKSLGGIMVLPVNWRSNLSFEGEDPVKDDGQDGHQSDFSLNDITQPTIPAVRTLISDVMLDIPYYLSRHKSKMIQAVISEANRVYRLWCKNNPDFDREGRVHIIAHSLGSVMAVEILSKQPNSVPKVDVHCKRIDVKHFDFNTTNLFCAGSPAGFFFYLEKAKLLPRRGQGKPGAEHRDELDKNVTGESGTFGCMAVDNVYNIMHCNDPIAYRLNATVDPQYASSLRNAQVPSATTGFFESIGNAVRSIIPGVSSSADPGGVGELRPGQIARLPSQLELEVHDFTREEITEKKFYLLNDNGQVDWSLSSGGGPLEIQYINMLGAHSSYWISPDFVRMIVTEVGREPGKSSTLPNMRATKVGHKPA
ncbi:putative phospholipase [Lachnellula occidentalis]|uniref:Putative phospholipase n=1 Tax=Lachnellula occidentalis TaxID=215460 RepID=A0A8H8UIZ8_9HELO|nr:putative phospholipase [Lachnellula occidentalis]